MVSSCSWLIIAEWKPCMVELAVLNSWGVKLFGVMTAGTHDVLRILLEAPDTVDNKVVLVPFVKAFVPDIDLTAATLTLEPVPGLLEAATPAVRRRRSKKRGGGPKKAATDAAPKQGAAGAADAGAA